MVMNILGSIFVFIISGYIAFTNALATQIENILPTSEKAGEEEILTDEMSLLPSIFGNRIPDILLSNAAYQQAALSNAGTSGQTASTPEEALVNVFCTFTTDDLVRTTTGSGFFIDPDGIIMTNAHVAQFLLLEETEEFGETDCIIRTGNPASPRYRAELLYLPPAWIEENADNLSQTIPLGTGERDYALLYVSESLDGESTPIVFPALMVADELLPVSVRGAEVVAAGYPASELIRNGSNTPLNAQVADTTISELYTFGSNYADVIAVRGSVVGAEGASGGPVLNDVGEVIGIIVTRGDDETDGEGSLRAITMSHISRTMEQETGQSLPNSLGGNLELKSQIFTDTVAPFLLQILEDNN